MRLAPSKKSHFFKSFDFFLYAPIFSIKAKNPVMSVLYVKDWSPEAKLTLFISLWEEQTPAAFFVATGQTPPKLRNFDAQAALQATYVDYVAGRAIKSNLSGDEWDMTLYDRDSPVPARVTYDSVKNILGM